MLYLNDSEFFDSDGAGSGFNILEYNAVATPATIAEHTIQGPGGENSILLAASPIPMPINDPPH
jgi:hypothetical protein